MGMTTTINPAMIDVLFSALDSRRNKARRAGKGRSLGKRHNAAPVAAEQNIDHCRVNIGPKQRVSRCRCFTNRKGGRAADGGGRNDV